MRQREIMAFLIPDNAKSRPDIPSPIRRVLSSFETIYTIGLQWRPAGVHPMLLLAAFTAVGVAFLTPLYLWEVAGGRHINLHPGSLASLLYVGIFPSFLGYIFYNRAVGEVGASKASLFIHLMPVFGTLLSAVFLKEIPVWYHYAGIALIFVGIWLTTAPSRVLRQ